MRRNCRRAMLSQHGSTKTLARTVPLETWPGGGGKRSDAAFAAVAMKETKSGKEIALTLIDIMRHATRPRDRALAAKILADRLWGLPPERVELERQESGRFTLADRDAIVSAI